MSIIYSNNIFVKQDYQKHSGWDICSSDVPAEFFYVNQFVDVEQFNGSYFQFNTPKYYTYGGTLDYYGQSAYSIFTNIARPYIRFVFTANTSSFGTGTTIKHDIYRISNEDYTKYKTSATTEGLKINLTEPVLTITASTTAVTANIYDLFLGEYQKKVGDFSFQLFEDYGQYFITTQFEFIRTQGTGYTDFYQLADSKRLVPIDYQKEFVDSTVNRFHTITAGTFTGINVTGNFFTYFLIPNKPKWEYPYVADTLSTFTPTFYWSNTDDGDSFLLQVVYSSADSKSFSATVYSYPINKESTRLSTNELLDDTSSAPWSITQKTTDVVRKYTVPLAPGKQFWYRIGNIKELVNLFGIKQQVATFSDIMSASTILKGNIDTAVKPDSPYVKEVPDWMYPEYLDYNMIKDDKYTLSGSVYGSVVTGATMQLIYQDGSYVTQQTDLVGGYYFSDLLMGTYNLNSFYRGYKEEITTIVLTANTVMSPIKLKLIWGDNYDTWGKMANENYYI